MGVDDRGRGRDRGDAASQSRGSRHAVSFHGGDVTIPLDAARNAAVAARIGDADVVVTSYVVAENAVALCARDYVFFRNLFREAKDGCLFVFAETTHRLWPEILRAALEELDGPVPLSLPTYLESGSTMIFQKSAAPDADDAPDARRPRDDHASLLRRFAVDNAAHERKLRHQRAALLADS